MQTTKGLVRILIGFLLAMQAAAPAKATNAAPGCIGIGVGLLNSYFDLPWSSAEIEKFSASITVPSATAFWGVEKQASTGTVETLISPGGGLQVKGQGTAFAIYQPLASPKLIPGFDYLLVDVLARVFVKQGTVGIALSAGPASFSPLAYPHAPFRSTATGKWVTIGLQTMVSANTPTYDRVSIVALGPDSEFRLGCITFVTHERNIGSPDPGPPTKGAMLPAPSPTTPG